MDSLIAQFVAEFGTKPRSFSAPGRINLIGEHTDYNKGFVLPAGIDLSCQLAIASSSDDRFTIIANDLNERINCDDLGSISDLPHWTKYIVGVIKAFETRGVKVRPFQAIVQSTIPIGAGLSSSAALESVFAYALNLIYGSSFSQMQLTEIAKEAENKYVGVQCGIMDMFASIHAQKDHAMFLDCRSLAFEQIPLNMRDHTILLFDTQIKHDLATSEYNNSRASCEEAVAVLNELGVSCSSLRDISTLQLYRHQHQMHPLLYKRAKHVVEENQRVMDFVAAMAEKNWKRAGALMYA
ncbi:MAG: galactokinase, partial [Bacteroidota bacterium]